MAEQRSSHYNWFKGNSSDGKHRTSKDSLKTVWKFSKLFLYFLLFFFSMWGCVQIWILKTESAVGRGVELYASQDKIAPQVVSVHVSKAGQTTDKHDIYKLSSSSDNIWINDKEDGQTFKDIQNAFIGMTHDGYTLDEANRGGNIVARLTLDGKEYVDQHNQTRGVVYTSKNRPLVFTTSAAKDLDAYTDIKVPSNALGAMHYFKWENGKATPFADLPFDNLEAPFATDAETKAAEVFSLEYAKAIINLPGVKDYLTSTPTNEAEVSAYNDLVGNILGVSQLKVVDVDKTTGQPTKFSFTHIAYGFSSNKYIPIATWDQAWYMSGGAGPFYGIFVYPIAWVTNKIIDAFPMMAGWESFLAIVLVVIVISAITFLLSFKGTLQQTKMQEMNAKKAVIDAKYTPYKGNKQMEMRQRQEVSELYKKEGINPLSSLATVFVTMPFFFAMWRVIGGIQHIKGTTWLSINFAATSYKELFSGKVQYLPLMVLAAGVQIFSQLYPRLLTRRRDKNRINIHQKQAMKKANKMQNIMLIVFGFMALIFSAGLQVYFLIRSLWRIAEVQATHHILVYQRKMKIKKAAK